jgi:hypothetical protein
MAEAEALVAKMRAPGTSARRWWRKCMPLSRRRLLAGLSCVALGGCEAGTVVQTGSPRPAGPG